MTVKEWATSSSFTVLCEATDRPVLGGYCGDLLSWAMSRAPADAAWMTVMGNVNAVAVAVLTEVACIVLCEGAVLDETAAQKAREQDVWVLATDKTAYEVAAALAAQL